MENYVRRVQIAYSTSFSGATVIDLKRRYLLRPLVLVDGRREGHVLSRHLRLRRPKWKLAYRYQGEIFCLGVDAGPGKHLSLKPSDWRKAFEKDFRLSVNTSDRSVGSVSGPGWTLQYRRELRLEIRREEHLIPFFVLVFLSLSEAGIEYPSGDPS